MTPVAVVFVDLFSFNSIHATTFLGIEKLGQQWQAIAGSLLDDGDTTTAVATAAGGWAGGLAGSGVAAAAASTIGIEAMNKYKLTLLIIDLL